jgi:hypothetical protein
MGGARQKKGAKGKKRGKHAKQQQQHQQPAAELEPEPEPDPPESGVIAVGDRVRIHGLSAAPQHNGKTGLVKSWDDATGRFRIQLDSGSGAEGAAQTAAAAAAAAPTHSRQNKPLGLRPANITRITAAPRATRLAPHRAPNLQPDEPDELGGTDMMQIASSLAGGGGDEGQPLSFDEMLSSMKAEAAEEAVEPGSEEAVARRQAAEDAVSCCCCCCCLILGPVLLRACSAACPPACLRMCHRRHCGTQRASTVHGGGGARAGLGNAQAALEAMDREEELALAHAHHAALFAKMDRMEPARDEWHMKWQAIEADAEQMVS